MNKRVLFAAVLAACALPSAGRAATGDVRLPSDGPWKTTVLCTGSGLTVSIKVKTTATLADEDWMGLEIRNDTQAPSGSATAATTSRMRYSTSKPAGAL